MNLLKTQNDLRLCQTFFKIVRVFVKDLLMDGPN